jgi:hypothetical protein
MSKTEKPLFDAGRCECDPEGDEHTELCAYRYVADEKSIDYERRTV